MNKLTMEKLKEHPYDSVFSIVDAAFEKLDKEQKDNWFTLCQYKISKDQAELLQWENEQISKARRLVLQLLTEHFKK